MTHPTQGSPRLTTAYKQEQKQEQEQEQDHHLHQQLMHFFEEERNTQAHLQFEQMWRSAKVRSQPSTSRHRSIGLWLTGLSATSVFMMFTFSTLSPFLLDHSKSDPLPQVLPLSSTAQHILQDPLTWQDGWLEDEEWSLEWPVNELEIPPQNSLYDQDREG